MKVGILTWYQAINHGAVLQTYASCKMLEKMECTPVVLNYNWELYDNKNKSSKFKRWIKKLSISQIIWHYNVKRFLEYKKDAFNKFNVLHLPIGRLFSEEKNLDVLYIGSDMVFDISEGYNPYMYGAGIDCLYKFSYAASFGYTTEDKLIQHLHFPEIKKYINELKYIGYRDENTKRLCGEICGHSKLVENIDPVLCYGFKDEVEAWDSKVWKNRKYILIYAYDMNMNDEYTTNAIKEIAEKQQLEIISCGYYHKWCNENVAADPKEFLEMFKYATYVITDTFHGTVFSLILHKKFATILRGNGFKVKYLLDCAGLEDRIAKTSNELSTILRTSVEYDQFDTWLAKEQEKSLGYINNCIIEAKKGVK